MTIGNNAISTSRSNSAYLIIGATSSLAVALCRALAERGHPLVLAGRDEGELELQAQDLRARHGIDCQWLIADLADNDFSPQQLLDDAGDINGLIIASGDMGSDDKTDLTSLARTIHINYTVPAQIATVAGTLFARKKRGCIVIIGSVAGDRGRQSNYIYGSAKAALASFASGLRNALCKKNVHVLTVKPGFIDTPMTWGMKSPLIASREKVAADIVRAMDKGKDVIYTPWFWRFIMLIIIHIPERVFKKLSL